MNEPKIPKTLNSNSIYKNPYLEIKVDTIEMDGNSWEYAYFTKPEHNAVTVIPKEGDNLYLVYQYRYPNKKFFWQFPAGMIDKGQTPESTAKIELQEEAGITAKKYIKIGTMVAEPGMSNQKSIVFVAEDLTLGEKKLAISEIGMKLKKFSLEEIQQMIKNEEITCGFTLSALLLLQNNYLTENVRKISL